VAKFLKHDFILPFLGIDLGVLPNRMCMVFPWMSRGTIRQYLEALDVIEGEVQPVDVIRYVRAYLRLPKGWSICIPLASSTGISTGEISLLMISHTPASRTSDWPASPK